jgi:hypothetical protein
LLAAVLARSSRSCSLSRRVRMLSDVPLNQVLSLAAVLISCSKVSYDIMEFFLFLSY